MSISVENSPGQAGSEPVSQPQNRLLWLGLNRRELMSLLILVSLINAMFPTILGNTLSYGIVHSILNTFGVSAIVWLAVYLSFKYMQEAPETEIDRPDKFASLGLLLSCVLPLGPALWVFITGLAFYIIWKARPGDGAHRSGWILLALSVPMFWSKRLFNIFSEFFLAIDASLVSHITRTERISNLVASPGGSGYLQIAAPCSSMANLSLAILSWVLFTQATGTRWHPRNILWCGLACLLVIAINVTRISLIGFFPSQYETLHGPAGNTVTSWVTMLAVLTVSYYGVGRGRVKIL